MKWLFLLIMLGGIGAAQAQETESLAAKERRLAQVLARAQAMPPGLFRDAIFSEQKNWEAARDKLCGPPVASDDPEENICLLHIVEGRIQAITETMRTHRPTSQIKDGPALRRVTIYAPVRDDSPFIMAEFAQMDDLSRPAYRAYNIWMASYARRAMLAWQKELQGKRDLDFFYALYWTGHSVFPGLISLYGERVTGDFGSVDDPGDLIYNLHYLFDARRPAQANDLFQGAWADQFMEAARRAINAERDPYDDEKLRAVVTDPAAWLFSPEGLEIDIPHQGRRAPYLRGTGHARDVKLTWDALRPYLKNPSLFGIQ